MSLQIALRFNRGRKRESMLSLISAISTIGVALGVAVLIIGLSAMNGFDRELKQRILSIVPHGEIEPVNPPFVGWQHVLEQIETVPGVVAAAPYLHFTGLVERDNQIQIIQAKGVDPTKEIRISALPRFLNNQQDWQTFISGKQQIIIGKKMADKLKARQGDWLTIVISQNYSKDKLLQPKHIRLQVNGILSTMNAHIDSNFALVPMEDAQEYLDKGQDIGGIAIKVDNIFHANQIMHRVGRTINDDVSLRSWMNTYGYMYNDIQMVRTLIYLAMGLVISVAYFNIVSTLVIAVRQRSFDISILRTLGAKGSLVHAIFIWYGCLTGVVGNLLGLIFGIPAALNLTELMNKLEYLLGRHLLSGDVYFIDFIPTEVCWGDVTSVVGITSLFSLLASWYPAMRASGISPAQILSRR